MMRTKWIWMAMLPGALLAPSVLTGQDADARVVPPGVIQFSIGGEDVRADALFAEGGGTFGGGISLGHALTPENFGLLQETGSAYRALFAQMELPVGVSPADLFAGNLRFDETANTRSLPLELTVGVLPKVQVSARLSVFRAERATRRIGLDGANVGINPDMAANTALLEDLPGSQLGRQPLLPLQGTPLGVALQARVRGLTGDTLLLPGTPLTAAELVELGLEPPGRVVTLWQPADLELRIQGEVLRSFGPEAYPPDEGVNYRVSAAGMLRLPTGVPLDDLWSRTAWPLVGRSGIGAGATADLFIGPRFWFSSGAEVERHSPRAPEATQPGRTGDASEIGLWFTPRYRLTPEISFGGSARVERSSFAVSTAEGWTDVSGSREWLGFSLRYTALPAVNTGASRLPVEFTLGYLAAFRGAAGAPAERLAYLKLSMERRFWGRE
jgi:hypothetical protein